MFNLLAGAFASVAALFGGMFGMHASSTPMHMEMGSTSPMHMGSTTPDHMGRGDMPGMRMGSTSPMHMGSSTEMMHGMGMPGVMGTVTEITGTTLSVAGHDGMDTATTTYSVDASNAKVVKGSSATAAVTDIKVGDHVLVSGTVTGTSVVAKTILDNLPIMRIEHSMKMGDHKTGGPAQEPTSSVSQ